MTTDTQSVLDSMTAAIINRKREGAKAVGLTPVGFEAPRSITPADLQAAVSGVTSLAGRHQTMFPYDDPQTVHNAIARGLDLVAQTKAELDHVHKGLLALGELYAAPEPKPEGPPPEDPVKVAERAADARARERFDADMKAKQTAAQEQVFGATVTASGWVCPTHGGEYITVETSRKGRKYRTCNECSEFEKEVTG